MKESHNAEPDITDGIKTDSTGTKGNSKTTGDSEVQDGRGVDRAEEQKKSYEKSDEQQEFLQDANSNTVKGNESSVKDGKGMTQ